MHSTTWHVVLKETNVAQRSLSGMEQRGPEGVQEKDGWRGRDPGLTSGPSVCPAANLPASLVNTRLFLSHNVPACAITAIGGGKLWALGGTHPPPISVQPVSEEQLLHFQMGEKKSKRECYFMTHENDTNFKVSGLTHRFYTFPEAGNECKGWLQGFV